MNIINPFSDVEHVVYQRTFLKKVMLRLKSDSWQKLALTSELKLFLKEEFGIDSFPEEDIKVSKIAINSQANLMNFDICDKGIELSINGSVYKSYEDTIEPLMPKIERCIRLFLDKNAILSFEITKINEWDVESEIGIDDFKNSLLFTFSKDVANDIEISESPSTFPYIVSKQLESKHLGNADLQGTLDAGMQTPNNFTFRLTLDGRVDRCPLADFTGSLKTLNFMIFGLFNNSISQDVKDFMNRKSMDI